MNTIALLFIKIYKLTISPFLGNCCRYHPTCSDYAKECFKKHPFFYAFYLTIKRLGKCHPFSKGGIDEVP